jgi:predicted  nucleic acid-binding Zn-ribbon protein
LSQRAVERLQGLPAANGRLEQLESRVAELEAQNRQLEKQRANAEKKLAKVKSGKDHATFYADSFAAGLMCALVGMEKASKALKRELEACTKANADLQEKRDAAEARKGATEGKLHLERQGRAGAVLKPPCFSLQTRC